MLTLAAIKAATPRAKPYKMADAGGLYLHVVTTGRRTWRMKYRVSGREQLLTFGAFPDMSLTEARDRRDAARRQLRDGIDPAAAKRAAAAGGEGGATFEATARAWHAHQRPRWTPVHAGDVLASLERDALPAIGAMPLAAITSPVVLKLLRVVERRGSVETARRLRQRVSAVFAFAMSEGSAEHDPAAIVRKALAPIDAKGRHPALTDLDELRELLRASEAIAAPPIAKLASRFLALTAVRLAGVRGARWDEIEGVDWEGAFVGPLRPTWRVPAERMKLIAAKKRDAANAHLVPLSREAVDVLRAARAIGGSGALIFPGRGGGMIGEAAIGQLYDRAGYRGRHVPHGWRASFSTILNERFPSERAVIDQALAHVARDKVEAAYNRAEHHGRRRALFAAWGTILDA